MNKNLSVSGVLQESWQKFSANLSFVYYLFVPMLVLSLIGALLYSGVVYTGTINNANAASAFPGFLLGVLSGLAGIFSTISLLFFLRSGKKDSWSSWTQYFRLLPKYIGVSILQGLMILAGLILFIIPGIYLAVRYAFVGYRTLEHPTERVKDLFAAEAKATEGNRVNLLLIGLVMIFIAVVVGALLHTALPGLPGSRGTAIADFLFELLITPFFTLVSIITYRKLTSTEASEATQGEKAPETIEINPKPTEPVLEPVV